MYWKDFYFDEVLGAVLILPEEKTGESNIMEDVDRKAQGCVSIQEEQMNGQPARMVGAKRSKCGKKLTARKPLDFNQSETGKEGEM